MGAQNVYSEVAPCASIVHTLVTYRYERQNTLVRKNKRLVKYNTILYFLLILLLLLIYFHTHEPRDQAGHLLLEYTRHARGVWHY